MFTAASGRRSWFLNLPIFSESRPRQHYECRATELLQGARKRVKRRAARRDAKTSAAPLRHGRRVDQLKHSLETGAQALFLPARG